ncbi:hypothetical protein LJR220_006075 [Bradyrhizobium sp. LjRoot220]|uniref:hypothetical protein n=1 Tax=Bradyrhizobium sp. LjRoot220 TaxID=3342284 RepID=UPI003ED0A82C
MADDPNNTARDQFAYIEYKEACAAYFHGVEIGYTVAKHYATVNALLVALLGALAALELKNPILPSPSSIARCIPWIAIILSILFALAVPHYWKHLQNCALRCAEIEKEYGGKLFGGIVETGDTSRFQSGIGLYAMISIVSLVWLAFALSRYLP